MTQSASFFGVKLLTDPTLPARCGEEPEKSSTRRSGDTSARTLITTGSELVPSSSKQSSAS